MPDLVMRIEFNRDDDKTEFGTQDRILSLYCFTEDDGIKRVGFSFPLGRKSDDTVYLDMEAEEFWQKFDRALREKGVK